MDDINCISWKSNLTKFYICPEIVMWYLLWFDYFKISNKILSSNGIGLTLLGDSVDQQGNI